jgi:hypothetical protein
MAERCKYVLFNTDNMKQNRRKINFICAGIKLLIAYKIKIICIIILYFLIVATNTYSHKIMILSIMILTMISISVNAVDFISSILSLHP